MINMVKGEFADVFESADDDVSRSILVLASAVHVLAYQVSRLGNADASTPMGAIEALGAVLKEGMGDIATGIHGICGALEGAARE